MASILSERRSIQLTLMTLTWLAIVPAAAYAQASIAGVVKDTSGAVLPGVTIEAASPALIEKTRSAVTDGTGQYKIENLRPGVYSVTFTLPGFNTVKREGIELTGTFTASVNADMRVGALEETITVTGETPVVDVQNTKQQRVLDREVINAIPTGRNVTFMAALIPAVTTANQDVGGLNGQAFQSAGNVLVHGNSDVRTEVNGVSVHSAQGNGAAGVGNIAAYQEEVIDSSGVSAEQKEGGLRMNLIPREGGNLFQGSFYGAFANHAMQGNNFTQALKDRGLGAPNTLKSYKDVNPAFGGPIARDKLWFFATMRYNPARNNVPMFFNKNVGNPNVWTYAPDTSRDPATNDAIYKGANARVTWQATSKNKLSGAVDYVDSCVCPLANATTSPEASSLQGLPTKRMVFGDWTAPVTNRLLFEASVVKHAEHATRWSDNQNPFLSSLGLPRMISVSEQSTGLTYRAVNGGSGTDSWNRTFLPRMAVSYITGAHAFKVGFNLGFSSQNQWRYSIDSPMSFRFNNGVPNQLTLNATPFLRLTDSRDHGLFAQDRWTLHRWTVTAGLRYDYFHVSFPGLTVGPGQFVPTRNLALPEADGVRWHDLEPRSGLAFDLFGNGKTALKVSLNKYLAFYALPNSGGTFTTDMAPAALLVTSATRSWSDADRNFVPDCDLLNPAANGECGAMPANFGSTKAATAYDPATTSGWNKRSYNWQLSAGVQHELLPRVSMDVSYFRTWFGNFILTDNRAVSASDYTSFGITAPVDPRLPGGGGYALTGLYDLNPPKVGVATDNYITFSDTYGKQIQHYDGVDITVNARPRPGLIVQGGTSTGRFVTDVCEVAAKVPEAMFGLQTSGVLFASGGSPSATVWTPLQYCHQQTPFRTQAKFIATYIVPKVDVQVSGTVQSQPGSPILATYPATNAVVAPSLGRNLSGNAANISVNLVEPGTLFGERLNQLDFRIGKILKWGRTRVNASLDLYNVLNVNTVLTLNNAFATWQQPQSILNARFAKVVVQLDF